LKVAAYYGCQIVRPYAAFDDQANPMSMDRLLEALGATVVKLAAEDPVLRGKPDGDDYRKAGLRLCITCVKEALKRGAEVIATVCPLCQFNLDAYHHDIARRWEDVRVPTVYFSQLMGLAFGLPEEQLGLQRGFVRMRPLQEATQAVAPTATAAPAAVAAKATAKSGTR
jgi:heterodisulfide reductase subunit B2